MSIDDIRHEAMSETPSTNLECFARARAGDGGNLWVTAVRQTGGRGRRGRPGSQSRQSLRFSSSDRSRADGAHRLSAARFCAGGLSRHSRGAAAGGEALEIKWPNDVLIGRRKTCGILMEAELLPDGRRAIVIGIGINIAHKPDNPLYPVTMLSEHGASCSPRTVRPSLP